MHVCIWSTFFAILLVNSKLSAQYEIHTWIDLHYFTIYHNDHQDNIVICQIMKFIRVYARACTMCHASTASGSGEARFLMQGANWWQWLWDICAVVYGNKSPWGYGLKLYLSKVVLFRIEISLMMVLFKTKHGTLFNEIDLGWVRFFRKAQSRVIRLNYLVRLRSNPSLSLAGPDSFNFFS